MIGLLRVVRLATAIRTAFPDVPPERALPTASVILATHGQHDPVLIAAMAYGESRLDWRAVNARGCWGALQVCGRPRPRDLTPRMSYEAGIRRLDESRAYCLRRRTPTTLCELAVFASGPQGPRLGYYRHPRLILARRARLRAALGTHGARVAPLPTAGV